MGEVSYLVAFSVRPSIRPILVCQSFTRCGTATSPPQQMTDKTLLTNMTEWTRDCASKALRTRFRKYSVTGIVGVMAHNLPIASPSRFRV